MSTVFVYLGGICTGFLLVALLSAAAVNSGPLDDTDDKVTGKRSNLKVLVDHGTGCQYLQTRGGGITPRLDSEGRPICKGAA